MPKIRDGHVQPGLGRAGRQLRADLDGQETGEVVDLDPHRDRHERKPRPLGGHHAGVAVVALSRRHLLRQIGAGAVAGVGLPSALRASVIDGTPALPGEGKAATSGPVRLHRNESAYGLSASVMAAIRGAGAAIANRYPDAPGQMLREKLATLHAVSPEHIVLGCGSGDILWMAASAFCRSGGKIVVAEPTFELIADRARQAGGAVAAVPLRSDYCVRPGRHARRTPMSAPRSFTSATRIIRPEASRAGAIWRRSSASFRRRLTSSSTRRITTMSASRRSTRRSSTLR